MDRVQQKEPKKRKKQSPKKAEKQGSRKSGGSPPTKKKKKSEGGHGAVERTKKHSTDQKMKPKKEFVSNGTEDHGHGVAGTSQTREPQTKSLPQTKVRSIMESSPNTGGLKLSGESIFAMTRAAEGFVEMLARGAYKQSGEHSRLGYNNLAQFVNSSEELNFIQDILPRKHKFAEVHKVMMRKRKHR